MRSGRVTFVNGYYYAYGGAGLLWASSAGDTEKYAYNFGFDENGVNPPSGSGRWMAFSLRCLAD